MTRSDRSARQGDRAGLDPQAAPRLSVLHPDIDNTVALPNMAFATAARFARQGDDLVLEGADGSVVVVAGYFLAEPPPTLVTPEGGTIDAALVQTFTAPEAAGMYAQAGATPGAAAIGRVGSSSYFWA